MTVKPCPLRGISPNFTFATSKIFHSQLSSGFRRRTLTLLFGHQLELVPTRCGGIQFLDPVG